MIGIVLHRLYPVFRLEGNWLEIVTSLSSPVVEVGYRIADFVSEEKHFVASMCLNLIAIPFLYCRVALGV